jgi:hypothetical protein
MYEIHVTITMDAPPREVFARLADYETFFRGPGMTCRMLAAGHDEGRGRGAIREVATEGNVFTEEITAFDPPRHLEYVVRKLVGPRGKSIPMVHDKGWLDVVSDGGRTRVDWYSRFRITIPIVGWFVERRIGPRAAASFRRLLEQAKANLEGTSSPHASTTVQASSGPTV